jgi:hypothetical protein
LSIVQYVSEYKSLLFTSKANSLKRDKKGALLERLRGFFVGTNPLNTKRRDKDL